jgi:hypothetical protein
MPYKNFDKKKNLEQAIELLKNKIAFDMWYDSISNPEERTLLHYLASHKVGELILSSDPSIHSNRKIGSIASVRFNSANGNCHWSYDTIGEQAILDQFGQHFLDGLNEFNFLVKNTIQRQAQRKRMSEWATDALSDLKHDIAPAINHLKQAIKALDNRIAFDLWWDDKRRKGCNVLAYLAFCNVARLAYDTDIIHRIIDVGHGGSASWEDIDDMFTKDGCQVICLYTVGFNYFSYDDRSKEREHASSKFKEVLAKLEDNVKEDQAVTESIGNWGLPFEVKSIMSPDGDVKTVVVPRDSKNEAAYTVNHTDEVKSDVKAEAEKILGVPAVKIDEWRAKYDRMKQLKPLINTFTINLNDQLLSRGVGEIRIDQLYCKDAGKIDLEDCKTVAVAIQKKFTKAGWSGHWELVKEGIEAYHYCKVYMVDPVSGPDWVI